MMNVPTQLTTLATAMAFGRGACRNSSAPIIIGIGPASYDNSHSMQSELDYRVYIIIIIIIHHQHHR